MLRNYLKIALRQLWRNRLYSLLNIGGLALGMAVSLLILLFVSHEFSYDRFRDKSNRIYRVWARFKFGDQIIQTPAMSARVGPAVQEALPGVETFVRVSENQKPKIRSDYDHVFVEPRFWLADTTFFRVFDVKLLAGNRQTLLAQPMTVVLSESMAHKYFGSQNPIGRHLTYNGKLIFTITGVMQNPPSNSSLQCDFVTSLANLCTIEKVTKQRIDDSGCTLQFNGISLGSLTTYFLVDSPQTGQQIPEKILELIKASGKAGLDGVGDAYFVQPLTDIHLGTNFGDTSNTRLVNVFMFVGLLVLALALVNYMNLTTARAMVRAKEVGVRKTAGASRTGIAYQFYTESTLTTVLASGVATLLVIILKPEFLNLLQLHINNEFWWQPRFVLALLTLLGGCVLLSGSYPALILSSFNPVAVLKGRFLFRSGAALRRILTVFQFTASVALVICTLIIHRQVDYFRSKDIGLTKAKVIGIEFSSAIARNAQFFARQIQQITGVDTVAMSTSPLFKEGYSTFFVRSPFNQQEVGLDVLNTNAVFFDYFHTKWLRPPVDQTQIGNPKTVILNETAAKQLGYSSKNVTNQLSIGGGSESTYEIIGILKDFNSTSLQFAVRPLAIFPSKTLTPDVISTGGVFYIRLNPRQNITQQFQQLKQAYRKLDPETPFHYYFLDQAFADQYKSEFRLANMFSAFVFVAILISCLGLFGLATFTAEQRTKEIGVRKVLGASVSSIVALLSKDFLKLVLIAIVIASPIAWYGMNRWLQDFAYKIDIEWWMFAGAGLLAVGIALLTVSFQSIKAALMNPVKSLRSE